ncbi:MULTISPECIES: hypothetical protein [Yersinia]|uniref:Lipoprotein n=1 Tax=Yersinia kristensenii TaxID=28152 RepID=A0A0T9LDM8_YERKR|nr:MULTISPECIES: hypothetical protein [Yersinia]OVZ92248.1 hypothetical protein CBW58_10135 [Yersinia frederiksenii]MDA5521781.1 hypothetical protein [Yersinia kristensenii]MDX6736685.1 hypothetical protein [Yersinia kristensenii]PHZ37543.1 hypothetical protein CS536_03155 [Yersinia kristensenii]CFR07351.1 Uncharacterised protein [Yersinia kristensenii]
MDENFSKLYKITFAILCLSLLSSCATKKEQQLLVYKINDEYFSLDKKCVERVYLRENRPIFYLNDNVIIELDNKKECVQQFADFISSNIGEKMSMLFKGAEIAPATRIMTAMHFDSGILSQGVTKRNIALEIVKGYAQ